MIYIDLRKANLAAEVCEEIDNGNGTFSYRQVRNGLIFVVDDLGNITAGGEPGQPYQSFFKTSAALVADRTNPGTGVRVGYLLPYAEVK